MEMKTVICAAPSVIYTSNHFARMMYLSEMNVWLATRPKKTRNNLSEP